jgi:hypothetical protein
MPAKLDQAAFIAQIHAESVRGIFRETGIEGHPRMLDEPEACPRCSSAVLMIVLPQGVCFECWPDSLNVN